LRRVSVSTRDLPLVEYLAGGFVHLVFRFGERLPFVFLVALVFRFGGEQRAFGEDSGTDAYAAAVDDVEEVGLSVQASSPQRFKGVSASFHVGFAYESVGAFGVAVAYGYGAVPVLEDLGVEVAYRFGEGSERVEQFAFGNVVLPCLERFLGVAFRCGVLVPDVEEVLLDVEGRGEGLELVDAAQQAYFLGLLACEVATSGFERVGKSALGFDAVLLGHGRLQGTVSRSRRLRWPS